jgi:hypothetical protein
LHGVAFPIVESYRVKGYGSLSVRMEDEKYANQKSWDNFKRVLHLVGEYSTTSAFPLSAEVEAQVKTVEIRCLDMHPFHLPKFLSFVSCSRAI